MLPLKRGQELDIHVISPSSHFKELLQLEPDTLKYFMEISILDSKLFNNSLTEPSAYFSVSENYKPTDKLITKIGTIYPNVWSIQAFKIKKLYF